MRSGAGLLMNLPCVSLCFNTKSQEWSGTHQRLSAELQRRSKSSSRDDAGASIFAARKDAK